MPEPVFDQIRTLRFRNRFGGITEKRRRCYKDLRRKGGYYPLDERLGVDKCGGFSPFLTFSRMSSERDRDSSRATLSICLSKSSLNEIFTVLDLIYSPPILQIHIQGLYIVNRANVIAIPSFDSNIHINVSTHHCSKSMWFRYDG